MQHEKWPESVDEALSWLGYSQSARVNLATHVASLSGSSERRSSADLRRSIILTAYADHISDGSPGLPSLRSWVDDRFDVPDVILHVLPPWLAEGDGGFAVTDPRTIDPRLGTTADLTDLAQTRSIALDLVMAHVGASSEPALTHLRLPARRDGFLAEVLGRPTNAPRSHRGHSAIQPVPSPHGHRWIWTLFGPNQLDVNYGSPQALRWLIDLAADYVRLGAVALRLDSVGQTWREDAQLHQHARQCRAIVRVLRESCDRVQPGCVLLAQADYASRPDHDYLGPPGTDFGANAQYRHEIAPLIAHALLTRDGGQLRSWIEGLRSERDHRWLSFLSAHDSMFLRPWAYPLNQSGIDILSQACIDAGGELEWSDYGNGPVVAGLCSTFVSLVERSPIPTSLARSTLAHAMLLALPGIPALYLGAVLGEPNGLRRRPPGVPRDINRRRIAASEITPERTAHARCIMGMVAARHDTPALHADVAIELVDAPAPVIAWDRGQAVRCLFNLGDDEQRIQVGPARPLLGTAPRNGWLTLVPHGFSWLDLGRPSRPAQAQPAVA